MLIKKKIINYYLYYNSKRVFITIHIDKKEANCYMYTDRLTKYKINNYKHGNKFIKFDDNYFGNEKIIFNDISISFINKNKNLFHNKINISNFYGVIDGEEVSGIIYSDVEKYFNSPYTYVKFIHFDTDKIIALNRNKFTSENRFMIYSFVNDNEIKENSNITCRIKSCEYVIKTYQYIYDINFVTQKLERVEDKNIDIGIIDVNFSIHKFFSPPFLKLYDLKCIAIMYNFSQ